MPLLASPVVARSLCWTGLMPLLAVEADDERATNSATSVIIVDINFLSGRRREADEALARRKFGAAKDIGKGGVSQ